jgi:hypothetical protein
MRCRYGCNIGFSNLLWEEANCHAFASTSYDIVINSGRVMDPETGFDSVANVGVRDGRIAVITTD